MNDFLKMTVWQCSKPFLEEFITCVLKYNAVDIFHDRL